MGSVHGKENLVGIDSPMTAKLGRIAGKNQVIAALGHLDQIIAIGTIGVEVKDK